ncbi:hypothetical protein JRQ81_012690, partial [Phrynocephalus forsythii]
MPYNSAHHCVVEVENFLFVLGGEDQWNPNGKHSTNFVSRYDPRFNSWIQLPPMQERRASFYACRLDKNLYVIGGRNETGYLSSVECYNLETNEWRYVSSLPQPLAAHAGAVHNGKIYISGGVHNGEYVPWLYCYDPVMDVWARKQDMNTKRAIHALAVMNDRLYAIGGNHLKVTPRLASQPICWSTPCQLRPHLQGTTDASLTIWWAHCKNLQREQATQKRLVVIFCPSRQIGGVTHCKNLLFCLNERDGSQKYRPISSLTCNSLAIQKREMRMRININ